MKGIIIALTLLWTPAQDADGYRVYTIAAVGSPWTLHEDLGPRSPGPDGYIAYDTPNPEVLTLYQVRAYNDGGETAMEHALVGYDPDAPGGAPTWPEVTKLGTRR